MLCIRIQLPSRCSVFEPRSSRLQEVLHEVSWRNRLIVVLWFNPWSNLSVDLASLGRMSWSVASTCYFKLESPLPTITNINPRDATILGGGILQLTPRDTFSSHGTPRWIQAGRMKVRPFCGLTYSNILRASLVIANVHVA